MGRPTKAFQVYPFGPLTPEAAGAIAAELLIRIRNARGIRYALFLTPDGVHRIGPANGSFAEAWGRSFPGSRVGVYNGDAVQADIVDDLLAMHSKHHRRDA